MDNYNDKSLMEKMTYATEESRKRHLERNEYRRVILSDSQIRFQNLTLTNHTSKERNQNKGSKHQRSKKHEIIRAVTKVKHQVSYVKIIEIINHRVNI